MSNETPPIRDNSSRIVVERNTFKKNVLQRLENGGEIGIYAGFPIGHGDNMYTCWAVTYVLSLAGNISPQDITFKSIFSRDEIKDDTLLFAVEAYAIARKAGFPIIYNNVEALLTYFAYAMGVQLPENAFLLAPQPMQLDAGPLKEFDREKVIARGEALRQETLGKKRIVISQSGGLPEKRFSTEQAKDLQVFMQDHNPDAYVEILSDENINDGTIDINEVTAHMYASDMLITTDSFWGWLGAGSRALRPDRNGVLEENDVIVLHTIADTLTYGIPGASTVLSTAIKHFRGKNIALPGVLSRADYFKYFYAIRQGTPLNEEHKFPSHEAYELYKHAIKVEKRGIDELDIKLLKEKLPTF